MELAENWFKNSKDVFNLLSNANSVSEKLENIKNPQNSESESE